MDLGWIGLTKREVIVDEAPSEASTNELLEPETEFCVETVTRKRDDDGNPASVDVAANEETDCPPFLEVEEANDGGPQMVDFRREELILRECFVTAR